MNHYSTVTFILKSKVDILFGMNSEEGILLTQFLQVFGLEVSYVEIVSVIQHLCSPPCLMVSTSFVWHWSHPGHPCHLPPASSRLGHLWTLSPICKVTNETLMNSNLKTPFCIWPIGIRHWQAYFWYHWFGPHIGWGGAGAICGRKVLHVMMICTYDLRIWYMIIWHLYRQKYNDITLMQAEI